MLKPLEIPPLTAEELEAVENLSRTTQEVRRRTRAQIVLVAGEQRMTAPALATLVREVNQPVRTWLKRWMAEGIEGRKDRPLPAAPAKVTDASKEPCLAAVRRRPRSLGPPSSMWTLPRLADSLAEQTGLRACDEPVRLVLTAGEMVLSRPQQKVSRPDPEYLVKTSRAKRRETG